MSIDSLASLSSSKDLLIKCSATLNLSYLCVLLCVVTDGRYDRHKGQQGEELEKPGLCGVNMQYLVLMFFLEFISSSLPSPSSYGRVRDKEVCKMERDKHSNPDCITSDPTASDENLNKLREAEVMDLGAVKHESEKRNPEERSPTNITNPSCSLDHGTHFLLLYSCDVILVLIKERT